MLKIGDLVSFFDYQEDEPIEDIGVIIELWENLDFEEEFCTVLYNTQHIKIPVRDVVKVE